MCKVNLIVKITSLSLLILATNVSAQAVNLELMTLFTTAAERKLIDNNRYKVKVQNTQVTHVKKVEHKNETKERISIKVTLAGVSLSADGQHVAWVNGNSLTNGSSLDDGSKVFISPKLNSLVQIKTPDGKHHSIVTGETIDLSYYATATR